MIDGNASGNPMTIAGVTPSPRPFSRTRRGDAPTQQCGADRVAMPFTAVDPRGEAIDRATTAQGIAGAAVNVNSGEVSSRALLS